MSTITEQVRNAPRRRPPSLPHWWGFAGGVALIAVLLVVILAGLGADEPEPVTVAPNPPVEAPAPVVIATSDGEFFALPEEAVLLGQRAVRGIITGDWSGVSLPPGTEFPVSWAQDLPALTVANPTVGQVIEAGRSYRLAFPVDPDGAAGPIEVDLFEVTVLFTPATGWVWLPDPPAGGG